MTQVNQCPLVSFDDRLSRNHTAPGATPGQHYLNVARQVALALVSAALVLVALI